MKAVSLIFGLFSVGSIVIEACDFSASTFSYSVFSLVVVKKQLRQREYLNRLDVSLSSYYLPNHSFLISGSQVQ